MSGPMPSSGPNPYDLATKIVACVLATIVTFFAFPFAYLSVGGVTAFSESYYPSIPIGLIAVIWGLVLAIALFASITLGFIFAIQMSLRLMGRM